MATVNTFAHYGAPFNFLSPHWWSELTAVADGNATNFVVFDDQAAMGFTGQFTYDKDGRPSGTAKTVEFEALDGMIFSVTGLSLDMSRVASQLENPSGGPAFMAYMLAGNDTIHSSSLADTVAGFAGDDRIHLSVVGGRADGGTGTDTLAFSALAGLGVQASLQTGRASDLASGAAMTLTGFEHLVGSSGNDLLEGNASANRIDGGAGLADRVSYASATTAVSVNLVAGTASGGGGNDTLVGIEGAVGGRAADTLLGNAAANWLEGGAGIDTMTGGLGNDTYVTDGTDLLVETADGGTDTIRAALHWTLSGPFENLVLTGTAALHGTGSELANRIEGNAGANLIDGAGGRDTLVGGQGNDIYLINDADVIIEALDGGYDTVKSTISYAISDHVDKLILLGSANINGTGSNLQSELIYGNSGNNVLDGRGGTDEMHGGLGNDTYVVDSGDWCIEGVGGGIDTVRSSELWYTLADNLENLVLVGNGTWDTTYGSGNSLANRLTGDAYRNELDGAAGADTMAGGGGDDRYAVDNTGDVVIEAAGEGIDTVRASVDYTLGANVESIETLNIFGLALTGNDLDNTVWGYFGNDTLSGGAGVDTLIGSWGDDVYILDGQDSFVDEGGIDEVRIASSWTLVSGIENATLLGTGDFNLTASSGANVLRGNAGNNVLDGGTGTDTLIGGAGNDTYRVTSTAEQTIEAADEGIDTVYYDGVGDGAAYANVENLVLGASAINAYGNAVANRITGNASANVISAGLGADTMIGGAGIDTYRVDNAGDQIVETNPAEASIVFVSTVASWTMAESLGASRVSGQGALTKAFQFQGNSHANILEAVADNTAADRLDGGGGADKMYGYGGNDTYLVDNVGDLVFEGSAAGTDTVIAAIDYTLRTNLENLTLSGTQDIDGTGNGVNNLVLGNAGSNVLNGGSGVDTVSFANAGHVIDANLGTGVATGWGNDTLINFENLIGSGYADRLKGNNAANSITGGAGADKFSLDGGQLLAADIFTDFGNGTDRMEVRQDTLAIGDGDTMIDGATTINSPGGYSSSAELVVVNAVIEGSFTTAAVAAALGNASSGFSDGHTMLVAVHNATDAAVYRFESNGTDAIVSSSELARLVLLSGSDALQINQFLFSGG